MFKLADSHAFWWPVRIRVPVDNGSFATSEIRVRYEPVSTERYKELLNQPPADFEGELLRATVIDTDKVADEDGQPIAYSDELLERLIAFPPARSAMAQGYVDAMSGNKARAKN